MSEFNIKKSTAARGLTIEGFANKAVKDRVGDLIPGSAWELDNFKKNPIIFFNHDRNIPIGKAIKTEAGEEGLKIKVKLSKSNEAPVPFIRDMIKEGIVKTFSVGFDDHGTFQKDEDGVNVPERAELLETSVVTLPMNQASDFDISKALDEKVPTWKTKSYHQAKIDVLTVKGAWVSAHLQDALEQMAKDVNFDKDEALEKLAMNSHLTLEQLMDVVTGNAKNISEDILEVLSEAFSLDLDKLKELNQKSSDEEEGEDEEEKSEDEPEKDGSEEEQKADDEEEDEEEEEEDEKWQDVKYEKESYQSEIVKNIAVRAKDDGDADEIVTHAIEASVAKKGDTQLTTDDYAYFFKLADRHKQEGDASDQVSLDASKENDVNFPNPHLDLQKAQLSMQGTAVVLLREIKAELMILNSKADGNSEPEGEEVETPTEEPSGEETEESKALDRRKKMLDAFMKRLDKLGSN
jgi:HK97 family phage prohead protease